MAGQGDIRGACACWTYKGKQVMYMDAYQIIMICIASVTLVLKLIELYHNISGK